MTLSSRATGLSPSMARRSRRLRPLEDEGLPHHHISPVFPRGIRIGLCRFRSTLLTASLLLSLPAGTKMIQFPAFPLLTECRRSGGWPIRESPDRRLRAPPRGLSQLATPFVGSRAKPSAAWRGVVASPRAKAGAIIPCRAYALSSRDSLALPLSLGALSSSSTIVSRGLLAV